MASARRYQAGISLLLFLLLMLGIGATVLLSTWNASSTRLEQERKTQQVLQQSKEAVIAWSVAHRTQPGRLPCPEDTAAIGSPMEGTALSSCSNTVIQTGRIAWRTLGIVNPMDTSGETLWYILSPGFRGNPPLGTNGIPVGQLQLDGTYTGIAAIIIAPGPPLPGQTRSAPSPGNPPQATNYLDMGNAGITAFVSTGPKPTFNDQVITISTQELFQAMKFRVLAEIRGAFALQNGLRRYYNDNGNFPPAGTALSSLLFDASTLNWLAPSSNPSNWFSLVTYTYQSPTNARLSLGNTTINVTPCTTLPCP